MVKNKGHIIWFTTFDHKNLQIYIYIYIAAMVAFLKGLFKKFRSTRWTCQATTSCKRCKNRFNSAVETTLAPAFPLTLRRSSSKESSWYSCAEVDWKDWIFRSLVVESQPIWKIVKLDHATPNRCRNKTCLKPTPKGIFDWVVLVNEIWILPKDFFKPCWKVLR